MTNGSLTVIAGEVPEGRGRDIPWLPPIASARRASTHSDHLAAPSRDDSALIGATLDARAALHDAASAAAAAASRAFAVAARLDEALAALTTEEFTMPSAPMPSPTSSRLRVAGSLSSREREVLALVATGRSNKAIAEALFVSPNTVKTHVTSLLHKLQAGSRVQLAAIATRQGLLPSAAIGPP